MVWTWLIVGVVLLAIEGVIPGVGIFGLGGVCSLLMALFLVLGADGEAAIIVAVVTVVGLIIGVWLVKYAPHTRAGKSLILPWRSTSDKGYVSTDQPVELVGEIGVAHTVLRPAGIMKIDHRLVDVVTEGEFIEAGTELVVLSVAGGRIVVRKYQK